MQQIRCQNDSSDFFLKHSLDSSGRFYDKKGYPADLFTKEDSATYEKKSQCFIDQFDKFSLQDANDKLLPLNGTVSYGVHTELSSN